jgi:hypothetical protein
MARETTPIILLEWAAERGGDGFRPVLYEQGKPTPVDHRFKYDEAEALELAKRKAHDVAAHYSGDWDLRLRPHASSSGPKGKAPMHTPSSSRSSLPELTGSPAQQRRQLRALARDRQREIVPQLRDAIRSTKQARKAQVRQCAGQCKHRKARLRKAELEAREQLKRRIAKLRERLRAGCGLCKVNAKDREVAQLEQLLAELQLERTAIAELRKKAGALRSQQGRAGGLRAAELRSESDDEVRHNVGDDPLLLATWERLKHSIKSTPHMSRTEAFLEHVHSHPEALDETQRRQEQKYDEEAIALLGDVQKKTKGGTVSDLTAFLAKLDKAAQLARSMRKGA